MRRRRKEEVGGTEPAHQRGECGLGGRVKSGRMGVGGDVIRCQE